MFEYLCSWGGRHSANSEDHELRGQESWVSFIACLISDQFFVDAFEVETLKGVRRRQNPRMPSFTLLDYAMGGRNPMLRWVFGRATLLQGPPSRSEP